MYIYIYKLMHIYIRCTCASPPPPPIPRPFPTARDTEFSCSYSPTYMFMDLCIHIHIYIYVCNTEGFKWRVYLRLPPAPTQPEALPHRARHGRWLEHRSRYREQTATAHAQAQTLGKRVVRDQEQWAI